MPCVAVGCAGAGTGAWKHWTANAVHRAAFGKRHESRSSGSMCDKTIPIAIITIQLIIVVVEILIASAAGNSVNLPGCLSTIRG